MSSYHGELEPTAHLGCEKKEDKVKEAETHEFRIKEAEIEQFKTKGSKTKASENKSVLAAKESEYIEPETPPARLLPKEAEPEPFKPPDVELVQTRAESTAESGAKPEEEINAEPEVKTSLEVPIQRCGFESAEEKIELLTDQFKQRKNAGSMEHDKLNKTYHSNLDGKEFVYEEEKAWNENCCMPSNKMEFSVILEEVSATMTYGDISICGKQEQSGGERRRLRKPNRCEGFHVEESEQSMEAKSKKLEAKPGAETSQSMEDETSNAETRESKDEHKAENQYANLFHKGSKLHFSLVPKYSVLLSINPVEPRLALPSKLSQTLQDSMGVKKKAGTLLGSLGKNPILDEEVKPRRVLEVIAEHLLLGTHECRSKLGDMMSPLSKDLSPHPAGLTRVKAEEVEDVSWVLAENKVPSAVRNNQDHLGIEGEGEPTWKKCSDGLFLRGLNQLGEAGGAVGGSTLGYKALLPAYLRTILAKPKGEKLGVPSDGTSSTAEDHGSTQVIWHNKKIQPSQISRRSHLTEPTLSLFLPRNKGSNNAEFEAIKVVESKSAKDSGVLTSRDPSKHKGSGGGE